MKSEVSAYGVHLDFFFVLKKNCAFKAPLVLKVFTLKLRCTRRLGEKINLFKRERIVYLHHLHFFCFLFKILFDISLISIIDARMVHFDTEKHRR